MNYRMKFLLAALSLGLMQMAAPTDLFAQTMGSDQERQEWEREQDRRRSEEGEHFDEAAYEFEKAQMARRHDLEEQFRELEEDNQQYWADKQRSDMGRQAQKWEAEQERRREDEGEYFDEATHEFERAQMERRQELEGRRIHLEEQLNEAFKALADKGLFGDALDAKREEIESRHAAQMEELEAQFRALDDEAHRY